MCSNCGRGEATGKKTNFQFAIVKKARIDQTSRQKNYESEVIYEQEVFVIVIFNFVTNVRKSCEGYFMSNVKFYDA